MLGLTITISFGISRQLTAKMLHYYLCLFLSSFLCKFCIFYSYSHAIYLSNCLYPCIFLYTYSYGKPSSHLL